MIKTLARPLLVASAALLLQSCAREAPTDSATTGDASPVLAVVGGSSITEADLLAEVERRRSRRQPVPAKEELLQAMIDRAALVHRAKHAGLTTDPEVSRALDGVLVRELRQRELHQQLQAADVSVEELRAAYENAGSKFTTAAKSRLAVLHLTAGKSATDAKRAELRERMTEARTRALANPATGGRGPAASGFGALAVEFSDDQVSRYRGGDIGWFTPDQTGTRWPDQVLKAGLSLETGAVSEVIESRGEFFLVTKTDVREAATTDFETAAPGIRKRLLVEKRETIEAAFGAESERLAEVEIIPGALARVEFPNLPAREAELKPPTLPGVNP